MVVPSFEKLESDRQKQSTIPTFEELEVQNAPVQQQPVQITEIDVKQEEKKTKRILNNADKLEVSLDTATDNDTALEGIKPGGIVSYPVRVGEETFKREPTPEQRVQEALDIDIFEPTVPDPKDVEAGIVISRPIEEIFREVNDSLRRDYKNFWDELLQQIGGGLAGAGAGVLATLSTASEGAIWDPERVEDAAIFLRSVAEHPEFQLSKGSSWKGYIALVLGNVGPYAGAATLATVVTGSPVGAFGVAFTVEGGNDYLTTLQNGGTKEEAMNGMFFTGTIVGTLEALQIQKLIKFAPRGLGSIDNVARVAKDKTWRKIILRQARRAGPMTRDFVALSQWEGITEALQELTSVASESRTNPEAWQEAMGRMLGAYGAGTVGFTLLGGGKVLATKAAEGAAKIDNARAYRAALPETVNPAVARKAAKVFTKDGIEAADLYVMAAENLGEEQADDLLRTPTEEDRVQTVLEKAGLKTGDVEEIISAVREDRMIIAEVSTRFNELLDLPGANLLTELIKDEIDAGIFTEEELPEVISSIIEANLNLNREVFVEEGEEGVQPPVTSKEDFQTRFRQISERVQRAEKTPGRLLTPKEQDLLENEGWEALSRSRGYSEAEIADFQTRLDLVAEGLELGFTMDDLADFEREIRRKIIDEQARELEEDIPLEELERLLVDSRPDMDILLGWMELNGEIDLLRKDLEEQGFPSEDTLEVLKKSLFDLEIERLTQELTDDPSRRYDKEGLGGVEFTQEELQARSERTDFTRKDILDGISKILADDEVMALVLKDLNDFGELDTATIDIVSDVVDLIPGEGELFERIFDGLMNALGVGGTDIGKRFFTLEEAKEKFALEEFTQEDLEKMAEGPMSPEKAIEIFKETGSLSDVEEDLLELGITPERMEVLKKELGDFLDSPHVESEELNFLNMLISREFAEIEETDADDVFTQEDLEKMAKEAPEDVPSTIGVDFEQFEHAVDDFSLELKFPAHFRESIMKSTGLSREQFDSLEREFVDEFAVNGDDTKVLLDFFVNGILSRMQEGKAAEGEELPPPPEGEPKKPTVRGAAEEIVNKIKGIDNKIGILINGRMDDILSELVARSDNRKLLNPKLKNITIPELQEEYSKLVDQYTQLYLDLIPLYNRVTPLDQDLAGEYTKRLERWIPERARVMKADSRNPADTSNLSETSELNHRIGEAELILQYGEEEGGLAILEEEAYLDQLEKMFKEAAKIDPSTQFRQEGVEFTQEDLERMAREAEEDEEGVRPPGELPTPEEFNNMTEEERADFIKEQEEDKAGYEETQADRDIRSKLALTEEQVLTWYKNKGWVTADIAEKLAAIGMTEYEIWDVGSVLNQNIHDYSPTTFQLFTERMINYILDVPPVIKIISKGTGTSLSFSAVFDRPEDYTEVERKAVFDYINAKSEEEKIKAKKLAPNNILDWVPIDAQLFFLKKIATEQLKDKPEVKPPAPEEPDPKKPSDEIDDSTPEENDHRKGGFIHLPPVTTVGKIEDEHDNISIERPKKDIGFLQKTLLTLGNQAHNTGIPIIAQAGDIMIDVGMRMNNEINSELIAGDHVYKSIPKSFRANKGELFFDLMDSTFTPEQIAESAMPEEVKKALLYFKRSEEIMRLEAIRIKRRMALAVFNRMSVEELHTRLKEIGVELELRDAQVAGQTVKRLFDPDADRFLSKQEAIPKLAREAIPDDWGKQWSHIFHAFFGQYQLSWREVSAETGKVEIHFIGRAETQTEAYQKLADWKVAQEAAGRTNVDELDLVAAPDLMMPFDVTRISRKHLFALEAEIAKAAEIETESVKLALRGIVGAKANKQKFNASLLYRKGVEGYSKNFWKVWNAEITQFYRWKYLSEMNRAVEPLIEDIKSMGLPGWAQYLADTKDYMWGTMRSQMSKNLDATLSNIPVIRNYVRPFALERWIGIAKTINYHRHLQTLRFGVVNKLQIMQTLWPVVGEVGLYRGARLYASKEGQDLLRRYHVAGTSGKLHEVGMRPMRKFEKFTPAGFSEAGNQGLAFVTLFDHGKRVLGMTDQQAAKYGRLRGQVMTQFATNPADVPPLMRGPIGGLILQYDRFPIKNLELVARMAREGNWGGVARWIAALLTIGGASALFGVATSLPGLGYITFKIYKKIKKEHGKEVADLIYYGVPGLIGIDLSGSVTPIDVPYGTNIYEKTGNIIFGPTGTTAIKMITDVRRSDVAKEIGVVPRGLKSLVDSSASVKQFVFLIKAFNKDTTNFDSKQRALYRLDTWDLWKKAFAFRAVTESIQRMQYEAMMDIKEEYDSTVDHIVLALIEGDQIKAEKEITNWNSSFPEAPISAEAIHSRIQSKILARELPITERGFQNLPKNLRAPFVDVFEQGEEQ